MVAISHRCCAECGRYRNDFGRDLSLWSRSPTGAAANAVSAGARGQACSRLLPLRARSRASSLPQRLRRVRSVQERPWSRSFTGAAANAVGVGARGQACFRLLPLRARSRASSLPQRLRRIRSVEGRPWSRSFTLVAIFHRCCAERGQCRSSRASLLPFAAATRQIASKLTPTKAAPNAVGTGATLVASSHRCCAECGQCRSDLGRDLARSGGETCSPDT